MRSNRTFDLVVILVIIAFGSSWYSRYRAQQAPPPQVGVSTTPTVTATVAVAPPPTRLAPAFALSDLDGAVFHYAGGTGPAFIVLNAVGCADCIARVPTDHKAVALARAQGLPVWNMLVFGDAASSRN